MVYYNFNGTIDGLFELKEKIEKFKETKDVKILFA